MQFSSTDKRQPGFFILDNEILDDYDLSPLTLAVYCWIVRWSMDRGRAGYVTTTEIARRYKKRRASVVESFQALISAGLIRQNGTTQKGAKLYEVLQVRKSAVPLGNTTGGHPFHRGTPPVPPRNTTRSTAEHKKEGSKNNQRVHVEILSDDDFERAFVRGEAP